MGFCRRPGLLRKNDISINSSPVSSVLDPPGGSVKVTERKQAIVKPVLTHVIEGFVIHESLEPFPVGLFLVRLVKVCGHWVSIHEQSVYFLKFI